MKIPYASYIHSIQFSSKILINFEMKGTKGSGDKFQVTGDKGKGKAM